MVWLGFRICVIIQLQYLHIVTHTKLEEVLNAILLWLLAQAPDMCEFCQLFVSLVMSRTLKLSSLLLYFLQLIRSLIILQNTISAGRLVHFKASCVIFGERRSHMRFPSGVITTGFARRRFHRIIVSVETC